MNQYAPPVCDFKIWNDVVKHSWFTMAFLTINWEEKVGATKKDTNVKLRIKGRAERRNRYEKMLNIHLDTHSGINLLKEQIGNKKKIKKGVALKPACARPPQSFGVDSGSIPETIVFNYLIVSPILFDDFNTGHLRMVFLEGGRGVVVGWDPLPQPSSPQRPKHQKRIGYQRFARAGLVSVSFVENGGWLAVIKNVLGEGHRGLLCPSWAPSNGNRNEIRNGKWEWLDSYREALVRGSMERGGQIIVYLNCNGQGTGTNAPRVITSPALISRVGHITVQEVFPEDRQSKHSKLVFGSASPMMAEPMASMT